MELPMLTVRRTLNQTNLRHFFCGHFNSENKSQIGFLLGEINANKCLLEFENFIKFEVVLNCLLPFYYVIFW